MFELHYYSAHSPLGVSVTDYIKYYAYWSYLLNPDYVSLQQLWYYFLNCVYPNPPCQLSLWEETGAPGENPRLSVERWLTLFTWVRSVNRTHDLRGDRGLLWLLRDRSPQRWSELRPSHFSNSFLYHSYNILPIQITRYRSSPLIPKSFSYKSYRDNLLVRGGWT
jgi:hypothetical protein